jgi:D-amino-acid oxidase
MVAPELAPPSVREKKPDSELTVDDLLSLVVEAGCGLRPARKGGIRLETEWFARGEDRVPVIFNYG